MSLELIDVLLVIASVTIATMILLPVLCWLLSHKPSLT
jgi:hypothetical protein